MYKSRAGNPRKMRGFFTPLSQGLDYGAVEKSLQEQVHPTGRAELQFGIFPLYSSFA